MKIKSIIFLTLLTSSLNCFAQKVDNDFKGEELFQTVQKYVSIGEHRTATPGDMQTSEWLGKELKSVGYEVNYFEFPLKQFFFESAEVKSQASKFNAFPLWYVSDKIKLNVEGTITSNVKDIANIKGKIAVVKFPGQGGQTTPDIVKILNQLIESGVAGIIGYTDNAADEIVGFNAPKAGEGWKVPIVIVSPKDAQKLIPSEGQTVSLNIKGSFKEVKGRNVYGKIGTGNKYIVVSTPISGWFICGGERGPGVATWLALAKWAAKNHSDYTFVFTGNSGHELGGWGAKTFLDSGAPPVDKTQLWVHLGAGIATLSYKETAQGLVKQNTVDSKRNFFYSASVKQSFEPVFAQVAGNKYEVKQQVGGELVYVVEKGYPNVAGAAYTHPYFHMRGDNANTTSPEILEEVAVSFKRFIERVVNQSRS